MMSIEDDALISILAVMIRQRRDEDVVGVLMKEGAFYFVRDLNALARKIEARIEELNGGWMLIDADAAAAMCTVYAALECPVCFARRMIDASAARITAGTGLTWSNVHEFKPSRYYKIGRCPHVKEPKQ